MNNDPHESNDPKAFGNTDRQQFLRDRTRPIQNERDLEDIIELNPSLLVGNHMLIGRQVPTSDGRIDLLAIDAKGVINITELKLNSTTPEVIPQLTSYLYWLQQLNTEDIIRVAARQPLCIDLPNAFQKHFGHPLPETVNEVQALTIIAALIDPTTQRSILALERSGLSTSGFRYVEEPGAIRLIPCRFDDQNIEISRGRERPPTLQHGSLAEAFSRSAIYRLRIDEDVSRFWQTESPNFIGDFVPFRFIYERYEEWVETQAATGMDIRLLQDGHFGRHLAAITAKSNEWTRIRLKRPGGDPPTSGYLRNRT